MDNNIRLKVVFTAGADIQDVCCGLCRLADKLGVVVYGAFNGVSVNARPDDNPLKLVDAYHKELESSHSVKMAFAKIQ